MNGLDIIDLALASAALVALGYVMFGVLILIPGKRVVAIEMLRVFFSATLVVTVVIAAFLLGTPGIAALMLMLSFRVGYEVAFVRIAPGTPAWGMGLVSLGLTCAAWAEPWVAVALAGLWPLLLVRLMMTRTGGALRGLVDMLVFPVLPMVLLAFGALSEPLRVYMFGAFAMVEIFDSFALVSGKLFGRHLAFPKLSPRKTIEGLVGGAIALCALTAAVSACLGLNVAALVAAALAIAVLAVAGDLAASRLKRMAGVKDYPVVMQRQGGLLDSADSWIAAGGGLVALSLIGLLT